MKSKKLLQKILLNNSITYYAISECWVIGFYDYYLVCQNIVFKEENIISKTLKENYKYFEHSVDKENIAKNCLLTANMRKEIKSIEIDKKKQLILKFENGSDLMIPTNTDIVDWQWSINKTGNADPYMEKGIITCFFEKEIEINNDLLT